MIDFIKGVGRSAAALALLLCGLILSVLGLVAPGQPTKIGMALSVGFAIAGFIALRLANSARQPLRAFRVTIGLSLLLNLYMLSGLPWPPTGGDRQSAAILGVGAALTVFSIASATRYKRLTVYVVGVLALYGAFVCVRFIRYAGATHPGVWEPALVYAYILALWLGSGWLAAFAHIFNGLRSSTSAPGLQPNQAAAADATRG